ncbi:hypothetical protein [Rhizobium sp. P44RR-XXIV]|uniref:hypothetical protein n=1 Tax=Rhizobium sp. P44RR-XXIV TaxID=1921145 RepID=UPI00098566A1|nr:hypothetical protein [Rhizobium sp. P44RR-XXIV]TIX89387.1 hypothetical protein BSK43_022665 [Rhizobium sp. P44RR-XXIV]
MAAFPLQEYDIAPLQIPIAAMYGFCDAPEPDENSPVFMGFRSHCSLEQEGISTASLLGKSLNLS